MLSHCSLAYVPHVSVAVQIARRCASSYSTSSFIPSHSQFNFIGNQFLRSYIFTPNLTLAGTSLNSKRLIYSSNARSAAETTVANEHGNATSNSISNSISNPNSNSDFSLKVAKICHPPSESTIKPSSHIPFEVKMKQTSTDTRSVWEQYMQGEPKSFKQLTDPYITLTKPNLTFLIMLSSICSYTLAPNALDISKFLFLTMGTLLASGAANAINMGREPNFDSQMVRTSRRPVVTGTVKPKEAFSFAAITGSIGCGILYVGVNPTVAALGALNIVLYSWIYTSLKRKSIINTWVGAVVGAIPPLMGWAANSTLEDPGAWCLALLLYAWQFPHFNSLSHNIKTEYKRAGYVMTAFVNPKLNARVSLRYSLLMFPICFAMIYYGVCDQYFAFDSSILNAWMTYNAFQFWLQQRKNHSSKVIESGGARIKDIEAANYWAKKTFWSSIWQLPVVLALAMLHKQGQWDRLFGNSTEKKLD